MIELREEEVKEILERLDEAPRKYVKEICNFLEFKVEEAKHKAETPVTPEMPIERDEPEKNVKRK